MARPNFKFKPNQRVAVPGTDARGVIVARPEYVEGHPVYRVRFDSDRGGPQEAKLSEHDLVLAQGGEEAAQARDADLGKVQKVWDKWRKLKAG